MDKMISRFSSWDEQHVCLNTSSHAVTKGGLVHVHDTLYPSKSSQLWIHKIHFFRHESRGRMLLSHEENLAKRFGTCKPGWAAQADKDLYHLQIHHPFHKAWFNLNFYKNHWKT